MARPRTMKCTKLPPPPESIPCCIKIFTNPLFQENSKNVLSHYTLSHNFLINCNVLSHNFYQNRTPCGIIFTVKGHPVERHSPSSQVWGWTQSSGLAGRAVRWTGLESRKAAPRERHNKRSRTQSGLYFSITALGAKHQLNLHQFP